MTAAHSTRDLADGGPVLCQAETETALATCRELPADGTVPEWVELLPAGPTIRGIDGRTWGLEKPNTLVETFCRAGVDLVVDWEHATEKRGPAGQRAPAAGWISKLEVRDGGPLWGKVDWTEHGAASIRNREYRYLSPAFAVERKGGAIAKLLSVGLTNRPNLQLGALNRRDEKEATMDKELLEALGLKSDATVADAVTAIGKLKTDLGVATNRAANPSLDTFVPRTEYDVVLNRAKQAETDLAAERTKALNEQIDEAIAAATRDGKILPANAEFYRAHCRQDGGLKSFQKLLESTPVIADASGLDGKPPPATGAGGLTDEQRIVCNNMGLDEEAFKKELAALNS